MKFPKTLGDTIRGPSGRLSPELARGFDYSRINEQKMLSNNKKTLKTQAALAILSLIGVLLVLVSTSLYGVGVSPDSTQYISSARSLLAGNGLLGYDSRPFINSPPLFAAVLAALGFVGIEPLNGARFLNAFAFGLIILAAGQLFLRQIKSKPLALLGTASVLLSIPLLGISIMAWTEPLFTLLVVLFAIYLSKFLIEQRLSLLFLLFFLGGLSCLQRYVGIAIVLTGFVLIAYSIPKVSLLKRFKYATVFAAVAVTPVVIWLIRNLALTSTLSGERAPSHRTLSEDVVSTFDVITVWFAPRAVPLPIRLIAVGFVISVMIAVVVMLRHKPDKQTDGNNVKKRISVDLVKSMQLRAACLLILIYIAFLLASSAVIYIDNMCDRLLAPTYVFVMLLVFTGMEGISDFLNRIFSKKT